jgi:hypothetical protein
MMPSSPRTFNHPQRQRVNDRRGMALIMTLILTIALGALAMSAVYLASGTTIGSKMSNRAADLQYAADAALQMGKSYINADPDAMPETGYREITFNGGVLNDAEGNPIPGITVRSWAGPTGATSGQFGAFGSIITEARDNVGGRVVRRLELAQENFARFAYWSNRERNSSSPIWFGGGDVLFGPVWSNDTVRIYNKGALPFAAQFRDDFGTAKIVIQADQGDFWKGRTENGKSIPMPLPGSLNNLEGYALSGRLAFTAPTDGNESSVRMRIEFVNVDIDNDGRDTDPQDGFIRVYRLNAGGDGEWLRGDQRRGGGEGDALTRKGLCGEWITPPGAFALPRFYTAKQHESWAVRQSLKTLVDNGGGDGNNFTAIMGFKATGAGPDVPLDNDEVRNVLNRDGTLIAGPTNRSQCFLGGAPEINGGNVGGNDRTFVNSDLQGDWLTYGGVIDPRVVARRGATEAAYLFPLHRSLNPGARGVINVLGTVGISGTLVGRVTLHTTATAVVLDDIKYGTNPAISGRCVDVLGILSDRDVVVADNMLNNQTDVKIDFNETWRIMDDSKDLILHAVVMAMNTSFRVENYNQGRNTGNTCGVVNVGRGCLMLLGGLIQEARGPVGLTNGVGYQKQYTYDRCANLRPPPYFPTTGRYLDNRYMELDPVGFDITTTFQRLTPAP